MAFHKYWNQETTKHTLLHALTLDENNGIDVKFFPSLAVLHLPFFHFPLCNLYGNVNGKRHILTSERFYHLGRCFVFTFLYLPHSLCRFIQLSYFYEISFPLSIEQDRKGHWVKEPWKPCHSDHLFRYTEISESIFHTSSISKRNGYWLRELLLSSSSKQSR